MEELHMQGWGPTSVGNTIEVTTRVGTCYIDVCISSQLHVQGHHIGSLKLTMVSMLYTPQKTANTRNQGSPPPWPHSSTSELVVNYLPAHQWLYTYICWITSLLSHNVPCRRKQWSGKKHETWKPIFIFNCLEGIHGIKLRDDSGIH